MKCRTVILFLCLVCVCTYGAAIPASVQTVARSLPDREAQILYDVAEEYGLSASESKLLLTIRLIENGRPGLELGVGSNYPNHPARRFARNPKRSLRVQGRWAAGTIRLHYSGDACSSAATPKHGVHTMIPDIKPAIKKRFITPTFVEL